MIINYLLIYLLLVFHIDLYYHFVLIKLFLIYHYLFKFN